MEIDCIGKPLFVAEASAANLDHFDPAIETFCRAVTDLQNNRIQYAPQVFLDCFGDFFDGLQTTAYGLG